MGKLYFPSDFAYQNIMSVLQGFWIDIDDEGVPALLIKLEASLLTSIVNGVAFDVVIRNPNITPRSCTLYIYDIEGNPFYVTWAEFSEEHKIFRGFDKVAIALGEADKVTVVLYNELSHPIFTTELLIENEGDFQAWMYGVYNKDEYKYLPVVNDGYYTPEDGVKGFRVRVLNIDNSEAEKTTIIAPLYIEEWRSGTVADVESFNYDDFSKDGKHGYFQELSIANNLSKLFTPNFDFFLSPKNKEGKEFSDFIILYDECLVLIESKYIISEKQTNRHGAIVKAINQLNKAKDLVLSKKVELADEELVDRLVNVKYVIRYCLLNDKVILSDENSSGIVRLFNKKELPIFMSVGSFFQMLVAMKIQNEHSLIQSLMATSLSLYSNHLKSDKIILYVREFDLVRSNIGVRFDGGLDLSYYADSQ